MWPSLLLLLIATLARSFTRPARAEDNRQNALALAVRRRSRAGGGCTAQTLSQLQPWTGTAPSLASTGVDPTLTQCGANLVDLGSDPAHCGAWDKGCWIWQNCAAGACVRK
jgi:hypothetical protein